MPLFLHRYSAASLFHKFDPLLFQITVFNGRMRCQSSHIGAFQALQQRRRQPHLVQVDANRRAFVLFGYRRGWRRSVQLDGGDIEAGAHPLGLRLLAYGGLLETTRCFGWCALLAAAVRDVHDYGGLFLGTLGSF